MQQHSRPLSQLIAQQQCKPAQLRPVPARCPIHRPLRPLRAQKARTPSEPPAADTEEGTSSQAVPSVPATAPAPSSSSTSRGPAAFNDSVPEQVFYEGSASNAEVLINLLLAFTLVYIPITIAVVGKRLWITYRFTNKRVQVINTSPLFARQVEVSYKNIKEVRTAPRAFGLWGDCVIFLKDGSRLEITGLEKYQDIKRHILSCIYD